MTITAEERKALLEAVREASRQGPREFMADGGDVARDERLWKVLVEQIGLAGLLVPEELGGSGAGLAETTGVLETLAGELAVVPALTSMGIATLAVRLCDTTEANDLLSQLADGSVDATFLWPDLSGTDLAPSVTVEHRDGSVVVSGSVPMVLDGAQASVLLLPAVIDGATALLRVDGGAEGVRRTALAGLDLTREVASIELQETPASVLAPTMDLEVLLDLSLVLLSAEQVGVAQRVHDVALAWAKERIQFDRPIGQFQAIKHQIADLYMDLELARSSLDNAVEAADAYLAAPGSTARAALTVAASVAKARCGDTAMRLADASLHILGGIGFTWEHDAHLYYRRAKVLELLLGDPATHRERFARVLLAADQESTS